MVKGLDIPQKISQIDSTWLQQLLLEDLNGKSIKTFHFKKKLDNGENYLSNIHFIEAEASDGSTFHLVLKLMPEGAVHRSVVKRMKAFDKECEFYRKILSDIHDLFPNTLKISVPKCYYAACDTDRAVIALKDMRPQGFQMSCKFDGLNLAEVEIAVKELALLHAAGYGLKQKYDLDERYPNLMHNHFNQQFNEQLQRSGEQCIELMKEFGVSPAIIDRLDAYVGINGDKLPDRRKRLMMSMKYMATICHGDTWCNNFLFRKPKMNDKDPCVALIDFQLLRFAHPAIDLAYLLFTSTTRNFRKEYLRSSVLPLYYKCLFSNLRDMKVGLGFKYPLVKFIEEYDMLCEYGFLVAMMLLPWLLKDSDHAVQADYIEDFNVDVKNNSTGAAMMVQERLAGAVEDMLELSIL